MARRVIDGQIGMFDVILGGNAREATSSEPPSAAHLPLKGKAEGGAEDDSATRTSSVPEGEGLGEPARVLTLEALGGLEPFRSVVWIETRPWATQRETEENAAYRFFLLYEVVIQTIGVPIGSELKHYHFKYTYANGLNYYHHRVDEFYGREWRVWDKCPTDKQREETLWLWGKNSAE